MLGAKRKFSGGAVERDEAEVHDEAVQAFWTACRACRLGDIQRMLQSGAVPSTTVTKVGKSKTIFHHTFLYESGHREVLELLLQHTQGLLDPFLIYKLCACWDPDATPSFSLLLKRQRFAMCSEDGKEGIFHQMSPGADAGVVACLLAAGADINYQDIYGLTPLARGVLDYGSKAWASTLLQHGARTDIPDGSGRLMLFRPASYECLTLLLEHGANVHQRGRQNLSALHVAAAENTFPAYEDESPFLDYMAALMDCGADPEARTYQGDTVLLWCAKQLSSFAHFVSAAELLLQYGANPHARDLERKTAYQLLVERQLALEDHTVVGNRPHDAFDAVALFVAYGVTREHFVRAVPQDLALFERQMLDILPPPEVPLVDAARRSRMMKIA